MRRATNGDRTAPCYGACTHVRDRDRVAVLTPIGVRAPDNFAVPLAPLVQSIQARPPDPFRAGSTIGVLCPTLTGALAAVPVRREGDPSVRPLLPSLHERDRRRIARRAAGIRPTGGYRFSENVFEL